MHNLDELIREWRQVMTPKFRGETLDELENHLREHAEHLVAAGLRPAAAFGTAVKQLGTEGALSREFKKLGPFNWLPAKIVTGLGIVLVLAFAVMVIARGTASGLGVLLGFHVFTITVGYTATFLTGAVGACFVAQRCFGSVSALQERAIVDFSLILGRIALAMTAIGVLLAMLWAKAAWGFYWEWDAKEIGGLSMIIWSAGFLSIRRVLNRNGRAILLLSLVGNIVVCLAWFGANLLTRVQGPAGTGFWSLLWAFVAGNVLVCLLGLAPAGCLRLNRN